MPDHTFDMVDSALGRCTFTATSSPVLASLARYTCSGIGSRASPQAPKKALCSMPNTRREALAAAIGLLLACCFVQLQAHRTCARDAAAMGSAENSLNTSAMGRPSSRSTTARACAAAQHCPLLSLWRHSMHVCCMSGISKENDFPVLPPFRTMQEAAASCFTSNRSQAALNSIHV